MTDEGYCRRLPWLADRLDRAQEAEVDRIHWNILLHYGTTNSKKTLLVPIRQCNRMHVERLKIWSLCVN